MAGIDTIDPANPCHPSGTAHGLSVPRISAGGDDGRTAFQYHQNGRRQNREAIAVVGKYALRRRTAVLGKGRVLTS
jgi:hypothetical protein